VSIWRFADRFPSPPLAHRITLGEGQTPLLASRNIGPANGMRLFFKLETGNPTGSYKDRFAAAAVADMLARGIRRCVATSSGNTGAALAAYCAAAGIACEIAVVETAPVEKLQQMLAYGAALVRIHGFGADADITRRAIDAVRRRASLPGNALQISAFCMSPTGMAGVQTIGYELLDQLNEERAHVFIPAGGGGLTLAVARGLKGSRHSVHCVQPTGNATIAAPLRAGQDRAVAVECSTRISGLQVASVLDGDAVIQVCRESGGTGHLVDDDDTWRTQAQLAREEGIFTEPAGAIALSAALSAARRGDVDRLEPVVCVVTGTGFKDKPSVERMTATSTCPLMTLDEYELR